MPVRTTSSILKFVDGRAWGMPIATRILQFLDFSVLMLLVFNLQGFDYGSVHQAWGAGLARL